jgi:hypothetical protein
VKTLSGGRADPGRNGGRAPWADSHISIIHKFVDLDTAAMSGADVSPSLPILVQRLHNKTVAIPCVQPGQKFVSTSVIPLYK